MELAPRILVNAVAPTFMETPFWRDLSQDQFDVVKADLEARVPLRRRGAIDEGASAYVHLMNNGFITGRVLAVDGGVMV